MVERHRSKLRKRIYELERALQGVASTANANQHMHEKGMRNTLVFIERLAVDAISSTEPAKQESQEKGTT